MDHVSAALESWVAVARRVVITGGILHAILLLTARISLGQAIFVHQIMMMMRAQGFAVAPSAGATLIRGVGRAACGGLATRPVALFSSLASARILPGHTGRPPSDSLDLVAGGRRGSLAFDFLLRGGLARVPVWACAGDQPALRV